MLQALNFVKGSVSKKDFVPVLTHVHIHNGFIQAYNGAIMLCSPIDLNLNCTPKASKFIEAVKTCKDTISMSITGTGRLSVRSKGFRSLIDCSSDPFPSVELTGERISIEGMGLVASLKDLEPLIGEDASRKWCRGIMLDKRNAFVTNNVVMAQKWLDFEFPNRINLPHAAVNELIRIKREPVEMIVTEQAATFIYDDGAWLRSQLISEPFPDFGPVFDRAKGKPTPIPERFYEALEEVLPFTGEKINPVWIKPGEIVTSTDSELATSAEVPELEGQGCYNAAMLLMLKGLATSLDFTAYPQPASFFGDKLRGVVVGLKL